MGPGADSAILTPRQLCLGVRMALSVAHRHPPSNGDFSSGVGFPWMSGLNRRALANQASGAARTSAVCEADRVVAYFALASGAVDTAAAPVGFSAQYAPTPIPRCVRAARCRSRLSGPRPRPRANRAPQGASCMPPDTIRYPRHHCPRNLR